MNHVTRSGETALMQAAKLGHLAVVQKLLPVSDIHATNEVCPVERFKLCSLLLLL